MVLMQWKDEYSVEVEEIDNQHKVLVNTINDLYTGMKTGEGKDALEKILNTLADYTVKHFSTEEKYMTQFGYPEYEDHKKEHENFVQKVGAFIEDFKRGKMLLSLEILTFLKSWLADHITGTDRHYIEFFHEHGIR